MLGLSKTLRPVAGPDKQTTSVDMRPTAESAVAAESIATTNGWSLQHVPVRRPAGPAIPANARKAAAGPGKPLPTSILGDMEHRFGKDLSHVRVHADPQADQAARALRAPAFTIGRDVFFASGRFVPHTTGGRHLVAHELAHVVQQSRSSSNAPGAAHEAEADDAADARAGSVVSISGSSQFGSLQCSPHGAGHKETVVTVRWDLDDWDFEEAVVDAVARSKGFRGVPDDMLPQALNKRVSDIHGLLSVRDFKEGHKIKLRISMDYDPDRLPSLTDIQLEVIESETKKKKKTADKTASTKARVKRSDQRGWVADTIGEKVEKADREGYDGYEFTLASGMGLQISKEGYIGKSGSRPSGIAEVSASEVAGVMDRRIDDVLASPGHWSFRWARDAGSGAMHLQYWNHDDDYKPAKVEKVRTQPTYEPLTADEEFELETGVVSPRRINKMLSQIGAKALKDSNPLNAKNLPYTIAGVVIPMGAMRVMMMDVNELGSLVRIEFTLSEETEEAGAIAAAERPTLNVGDLIETPNGPGKIVSIDGDRIVAEGIAEVAPEVETIAPQVEVETAPVTQEATVSAPKAGPTAAAEEKPQLFENQFKSDEVGPPIQEFSLEAARRPNFSRKMNYVVMEDGELRLGRISQNVGGGHIDLAGGKPVRAAGEVKIVDGQIRYIDNSSGHYLPSGPAAQRAAEEAFENAGFETAGKYIEKFWNGEKWVPK